MKTDCSAICCQRERDPVAVSLSAIWPGRGICLRVPRPEKRREGKYLDGRQKSVQDSELGADGRPGHEPGSISFAPGSKRSRPVTWTFRLDGSQYAQIDGLGDALVRNLIASQIEGCGGRWPVPVARLSSQSQSLVFLKASNPC